MQISARNVLSGTVRAIKEGPVNSQVTVELAGGESVTSMITTDAVHELKLEVGKPVHVIIKASEVLLGID
ncbi:MAG: TOBE domain-containing protein [Wenzhouxiangellaceae bacterium]|nr:TOBE domain-containing protein [Wenzhouxiangellaceae bacterium]